MHIFCYDDFIHNYYWPFYFIDKYRSTQPCKLSASWHECCHCCEAGGREREPPIFAQHLEEKIATLHFTSVTNLSFQIPLNMLKKISPTSESESERE